MVVKAGRQLFQSTSSLLACCRQDSCSSKSLPPFVLRGEFRYGWRPDASSIRRQYRLLSSSRDDLDIVGKKQSHTSESKPSKGKSYETRTRDTSQDQATDSLQFSTPKKVANRKTSDRLRKSDRPVPHKQSGRPAQRGWTVEKELEMYESFTSRKCQKCGGFHGKFEACIRPMTKRTTKKIPALLQTAKKHLVCTNCGTAGHEESECPIIRICTNCGLPGHTIAQCTQPLKCMACGEHGHSHLSCPHRNIGKPENSIAEKSAARDVMKKPRFSKVLQESKNDSEVVRAEAELLASFLTDLKKKTEEDDAVKKGEIAQICLKYVKQAIRTSPQHQKQREEKNKTSKGSNKQVEYDPYSFEIV